MLFFKLTKLPLDYLLIPKKTIMRKNILIGGVSILYIKIVHK